MTSESVMDQFTFRANPCYQSKISLGKYKEYTEYVFHYRVEYEM